ncbi:MAG: arginine--tRNA ligase [Chitinophagaceae bacterium]
MTLAVKIKLLIQTAIQELYGVNIDTEQLTINNTKDEFEGQYTFVTFGLSKTLRKKPEEIGEEMGHYLVANQEDIEAYSVIKGFLNLSFQTTLFSNQLEAIFSQKNYGTSQNNGKRIMVEFSSPNTNKPLHFGHLRNIFLGDAISSILKANGYEVIKANLINDRGIHICKSMIAWQLFAQGATPQSTHTKGDHFVGDYYVKFNDEHNKQIQEAIANGESKEVAEKNTPILKAAQELLLKWEAHDEETIALWKKMNGWVYEGFDVSYKKLGITFDKMYYESNTYLLGKDVVLKGLQEGTMIQKEDQSVWVDLTDHGLDEKLLLRKDGTSVYMTQDIGTAILKYEDCHMDQSVYVIGDEQNYHMQVLKLTLQKMKQAGADGIYHLSYGMVELPSGKMKSREGTVVDADDMVEEMIQIAQKNTEELGKVDGFTQEELTSLYATLGLGALKFYLLRVDPKKRMIFDPKESIDFHGYTAPFVQYTHARICSILRKNSEPIQHMMPAEFSKQEIQLIQFFDQYVDTLHHAAHTFNPALVCNYLYELSQHYNSFLVNHSILKAENKALQNNRMMMSIVCKNIIQHGMQLLGIQVPERM